MDRVYKIFLLYILFFVGSEYHLAIHTNKCSFPISFISQSTDKSQIRFKNAANIPVDSKDYCFDDIDDKDDDTVVTDHSVPVPFMAVHFCRLTKNTPYFKSYLRTKASWQESQQDRNILHCIIRV
ncbi:hypothetical protein A8C56_08845 [Niabella ginsenosidivorans]|uniref:Uncharacterized protein n=1 Tax=Niabella ginsenosidivorans TaxID=1176587 RepID=A0A1A9I314_9BACT|nr:hypothetical protein [Niabella ginsenosidivorans]ANH81072.1 hypothetical protein A8C56_08845 [Niabella ginsenosidivorans]